MTSLNDALELVSKEIRLIYDNETDFLKSFVGCDEIKHITFTKHGVQVMVSNGTWRLIGLYEYKQWKEKMENNND